MGRTCGICERGYSRGRERERERRKERPEKE
jgi:hypothetical protein